MVVDMCSMGHENLAVVGRESTRAARAYELLACLIHIRLVRLAGIDVSLDPEIYPKSGCSSAVSTASGTTALRRTTRLWSISTFPLPGTRATRRDPG